MTGLILSPCSLTLGATLPLSSWCGAEHSTAIHILSPGNGESVPGTFESRYENLIAPEGSHAQAHLDGAYQNGFKGTFTQVPKGEHTITVKSPVPITKICRNGDR